MLIFGTPDGFTKLTFRMDIDEKFYLFNFNELIESVTPLTYLNPYFNNSINIPKAFTNDMTFDQWYINYLTTTPEAFRELIDIMRLIYNGCNVYILCSWNNEVSINLIEALSKFIIDNYGYVCGFVQMEDDLQYIEKFKKSTFSIEGIQLFDRNMETYINLFGHRNLPSDPD